MRKRIREGQNASNRYERTPHEEAIIAEAHQDTWFATAGCNSVAVASKGTRPGDPWGDIIWNVLHAQVMAEVEEKMRNDNLTEKMELHETAKWLLSGEEADMDETEIADASFVDDVAMIFSADNPGELNDKA